MTAPGSVPRLSATPEAPSTADDAALVARVQTGDIAAFETLFRIHSEGLCAHACRYLQSREEARDVVQDLFLWIWDHRYEWRVEGSLQAYLYRSTHNRSFGRLRHRRLEQRFRDAQMRAVESTSAAVAPDHADAAAHLSDLAQAVERVMADLPERCREVFALNRQHHLTYPQIAEVFDISVKTVEAHMGRALKVLRAKLTDWTAP
jgi:RNA polymerase sigma-70 factor (ECF subfamily)